MRGGDRTAYFIVHPFFGGYGTAARTFDTPTPPMLSTKAACASGSGFRLQPR
jgi:hypothetical protein